MNINIDVSNRLKTVANSVVKGSIVADIGTDHGYVPIYLIQNNIAKKVIAMDVNKGPLLKANENIKKYQLENKIVTRLSNGLEKLNMNEVTTVTIGGMGGKLVNNILLEGKSVLESVEQLVLQPQSEIPDVRKMVHSLGYLILDEKMIYEEGKYYFVIDARKGIETYTNDRDYLFGKKLIENKDKVFIKYLEYKIKKKETVISHLEQEKGNNSLERCEELKEEIIQIEEVLKCL